MLQKYREICFWIGGMVLVITIFLNFALNKERQFKAFRPSNLPTTTDKDAYKNINKVIADEQAFDDILFGVLGAGAIPILIGILIGKYVL
ncbi:MAG: hypothetical protein HN741_05045 [Anaerolineae bacterium]|nr:hypothetical protein [Anaerolineae bacterium]